MQADRKAYRDILREPDPEGGIGPRTADGHRAGLLLPTPDIVLTAGTPWAACKPGSYRKCPKRQLQE